MIPYRTFPGIDLGPVTIRTFGLFVGAGLLAGAALMVHHGGRHGVGRDRLERLALRALILGMVGARLLFVLAHPGSFADRPWAVVAVWEGGLEFSGGFVLVVAYLLRWLRANPDVPGPVVADGMALGLAAGLAIGRLGCYAVGEHLGGTTSFFLGVQYLGGPTREGPIPVGAVVHNTALYEIVLLLPLIGLLLAMRRRAVAPGALAATFLVWYGVQRFATDALRAYDRRVLGLTGAQFVCVGLVVAGITLAVRRRRRTAIGGGVGAAAEPEGAAVP